jgi:hypothetical protein
MEMPECLKICTNGMVSVEGAVRFRQPNGFGALEWVIGNLAACAPGDQATPYE